MRKIYYNFIILCFAVVFCPSLIQAEVKAIDNFTQYTEGDFPDWKTYPLYKAKAKKVYQVKSESGNKYLAATDDEHLSVPIFKNFVWDLNQYPILKFRWRAKKLPAGAKETSRSTNDSACGIYVGFGNKLSGVAQKYVWSTSAPKGYVWEKDKNKFFIVIQQSGASGLGQWHEVSIQVAEDYKKFFKTNTLRNPFGIGVLTDGNAVKDTASCDYDDFRVSS